MALKVAQKKRVVWPVTVNVPQDGGDTKKEKFKIEFAVLSADEQQRVIDSREDLLEHHVVGWPEGEGPKDEADQRVPFSPEAKKELLNTPYARTALFDALGEINSGRAAARKN